MKNFISRLFSKILNGKIEATVENDGFNNDIELLSLNNHTLRYYRKSVKGNENISEEQARRKMTRNMMLALPYKKDDSRKEKPRTWYAYGCLKFMVKEGEVVWMLNKQPIFKEWSKDWDRYYKLNEQLGIESD